MMVQALVEANALAKSFGAKSVLRDVSLTVAPGDVIGVLGENGAGKSTLLELILGFTPASAGSVRVFEHDSRRLPAAGKARIGFVPQQDELLDQLAVRDQLSLIRSFHARWNDALVAELTEKWRIDPEARIRDLSIGQRQKLAILLALGHEPELLVLDEPMASLDPVARRHFLEQIVDIAGDRGRSVILSSHIVSDIERLANKIWLIKDGGLYWAGESDDLKDHVLRLHLRSARDLPPDLAIPGALSVERGPKHATAVVLGWTEAAGRQLGGMGAIEIAVESLSLEDIFVELHR